MVKRSDGGESSVPDDDAEYELPARSPAERLWFGEGDGELSFSMCCRELGAMGTWRDVEGNPVFHIRYKAVGPRLIVLGRRYYRISRNEWSFTGREYNEERMVCTFRSSANSVRRIECILA